MIRQLRTNIAAELERRSESIMHDIWGDVSELADLASMGWLDAYEIIMGTTAGRLQTAQLGLFHALAQVIRP